MNNTQDYEDCLPTSPNCVWDLAFRVNREGLGVRIFAEMPRHFARLTSGATKRCCRSNNMHSCTKGPND